MQSKKVSFTRESLIMHANSEALDRFGFLVNCVFKSREKKKIQTPRKTAPARVFLCGEHATDGRTEQLKSFLQFHVEKSFAASS